MVLNSPWAFCVLLGVLASSSLHVLGATGDPEVNASAKAIQAVSLSGIGRLTDLLMRQAIDRVAELCIDQLQFLESSRPLTGRRSFSARTTKGTECLVAELL